MEIIWCVVLESAEWEIGTILWLLRRLFGVWLRSQVNKRLEPFCELCGNCCLVWRSAAAFEDTPAKMSLSITSLKHPAFVWRWGYVAMSASTGRYVSALFVGNRLWSQWSKVMEAFCELCGNCVVYVALLQKDDIWKHTYEGEPLTHKYEKSCICFQVRIPNDSVWISPKLVPFLVDSGVKRSWHEEGASHRRPPIPSMDPAIWSNLSEDLLHLVFARLEPP